MKKFLFIILVAVFGCSASVEDIEEANKEKTQAIVGGLQINEVMPSGSKFVEIFNGGATSFNLAGYKIATGRSDTGVETSSACLLSGSLGAGSYSQARNSCGGATSCTTCAALNFSDPDGSGPVNREFYILNPNGSIFEKVTLPNPNGTPVQQCSCRYNFMGQYVCSQVAPAIGQSWGAIPNGGDCFNVTGSPSPLSAN